MKALVIVGVVLIALGAFALFQTLAAIQHARQSGIGAVAGGIGPVALLGVGILLLLIAAVLAARRR